MVSGDERPSRQRDNKQVASLFLIHTDKAGDLSTVGNGRYGLQNNFTRGPKQQRRENVRASRSFAKFFFEGKFFSDSKGDGLKPKVLGRGVILKGCRQRFKHRRVGTKSFDSGRHLLRTLLTVHEDFWREDSSEVSSPRETTVKAADLPSAFPQARAQSRTFVRCSTQKHTWIFHPTEQRRRPLKTLSDQAAPNRAGAAEEGAGFGTKGFSNVGPGTSLTRSTSGTKGRGVSLAVRQKRRQKGRRSGQIDRAGERCCESPLCHHHARDPHSGSSDQICASKTHDQEEKHNKRNEGKVGETHDTDAAGTATGAAHHQAKRHRPTGQQARSHMRCPLRCIGKERT